MHTVTSLVHLVLPLPLVVLCIGSPGSAVSTPLAPGASASAVVLVAKPAVLDGAETNAATKATGSARAQGKKTTMRVNENLLAFDCTAQGCEGTGTQWKHSEETVGPDDPRYRKQQQQACARGAQCKSCNGSGLAKTTRIDKDLRELARKIAKLGADEDKDKLRDALIATLAYSVAARTPSAANGECTRHPAKARHGALAKVVEQSSLQHTRAAREGEGVLLVLQTPREGVATPTYQRSGESVFVTGSLYHDLEFVQPLGFELDRGLKYLLFATKGTSTSSGGTTRTQLRNTIAVPFPRH